MEADLTASDRSRDVRHAALGAGTNLLTILVGLVEAAFHPLAARLFGTSSYGIYRWVTSSAEPLLRLSPLGTEFALLRHVASHRVAGEPHLVQASLRTALRLTLVSSSIFAVAAIALAGPLSRLQGRPETAGAIRWLAPGIPLTALVTVLMYATMGAKTTKYNFTVRGVAQPLLLFGLAVSVGLWSPSLAALCGSHLVAMGATAALALWAAARVFGAKTIWLALSPFRPSTERPDLHREMIRFAVPMGISDFVNAVLQRADLIVIGFFAGTEAVGLYAGAEFISRAISNVRYAFDPVVSPMLSESLRQNDRERLAYTLRLMTRWTTLLTIPLLIVMITIRKSLLGLFPAAFLSAEGVLVTLMLGHFLNGCLGLTGYVIAMSGRSLLALANNVGAATVNVVLCLVLVPRIGSIGAAASVAFSVGLLQMLQVVEVAILYRILPFSKGTVKAVAAGAVAMLLTGYLLPAAQGSYYQVLHAGIATVTYGALLLAFGLGAEERTVMTNVLRSFRRADR